MNKANKAKANFVGGWMLGILLGAMYWGMLHAFGPVVLWVLIPSLWLGVGAYLADYGNDKKDALPEGLKQKLLDMFCLDDEG